MENEKILSEAGETNDVSEQHLMTAKQRAKNPEQKYKRDYKKLMKDAWTR